MTAVRQQLPTAQGRSTRGLVPTLIFMGIVVAVVSSLGAPLIPAIASADGVTLTDAQWSLTATLLVGAVATPIMGRLGDGGLPRARLNVLGTVLLGAGLVALILWVSEGDAWGWFSPRSVVAIVVALVATAAWAGHEVLHRRPLVGLRLLRHRGVLAASVAAVLAGFGTYLLISLVVRFVQTPVGAAGGLGGSVVVAGLMLLPFSAGSFAASRITPVVASRGGGRLLIPAASVLAIAGMVLFGLLRQTIGELAVVMATVGLAVGTVFAAMPDMITRAVPAQETGSAMNFNQVLRYVGYSTGSAVSAAILAAHTPDGQRYPSVSGYTVAAFLGVVLWLALLAAGALLPTRHRTPAGQAMDEQMLAEESIADALPGDGNLDRTASMPR